MLLRKLNQDEINNISDKYHFNDNDKQVLDWWLNVRIYSNPRNNIYPQGSLESALSIVDESSEGFSPLNFSFWDAVNEGISIAIQFEDADITKIIMQLNNIYEEELPINDYI